LTLRRRGQSAGRCDDDERIRRHVHEAVVVESERVGHGQETVVLLPVERERVRRPVGEVAGVRVRVVLEGDAELFVDA